MADGKVTRREFIRAGAAAGLAAASGASASSASGEEAAPDQRTAADPATLAGGMPHGKIGDLKISRLILGSNHPGAHSRDLLYVSALGRAYNTRERMLATYELAESEGINTVLQGSTRLIGEYNRQLGGNLRTILPVHVTKDHDKKSIRNILAAARKNDLAGPYLECLEMEMDRVVSLK